MGYCGDDVDVYGTPASIACPVACDTCQLGMCFEGTSNKLNACGGWGGQGPPVQEEDNAPDR